MSAAAEVLPPPDHVPVLVDEVLAHLDPRPGAVIVDATVGEGGHAEAILRRIAPAGRLIGLDRDPDALARAEERLRRFGRNVTLRHANFADLDDTLDALGVKAVDGILFDLGLSARQLLDPERGFSFDHPGPLDMRVDRSQATTAADLVNSLPERELADLLARYGEERAPGPHPPRDPDVSGPPDRHQRRARSPREGAPPGHQAPPARRAVVRDLLPLARGPDRQGGAGPALPRVRVPARGPGVPLRGDEARPDPHQEAGRPVARGSAAQPPRAQRPPSRCGTAERGRAVPAPGATALMTRLHQVSTTRSPVLPGELWVPEGKGATRRRRRRSPIFVALAIAALIVLPLLAYIATVSNAARIGYHILQLNRDIAVLESDHERLQAIASSLRSPDRLERVAESRLGLRP